MIPLQTIKVASPCHADWDEMPGDSQSRFCNTCRKNVYNLSEMTHEEAQALVSRHEGKLCVRFYTRADGTMLTQDCPVGLRAVRRKLVKKLSYAAALLISCGSGLLRGAGVAQAVTIAKKPAPAAKPCHAPHVAPPRALMGKMVMPRPLMGRVAASKPPPAPFTSSEGHFVMGGPAPPPMPPKK